MDIKPTKLVPLAPLGKPAGLGLKPALPPLKKASPLDAASLDKPVLGSLGKKPLGALDQKQQKLPLNKPSSPFQLKAKLKNGETNKHLRNSLSFSDASDESRRDDKLRELDGNSASNLSDSDRNNSISGRRDGKSGKSDESVSGAGRSTGNSDLNPHRQVNSIPVQSVETSYSEKQTSRLSLGNRTSFLKQAGREIADEKLRLTATIDKSGGLSDRSTGPSDRSSTASEVLTRNAEIEVKGILKTQLEDAENNHNKLMRAAIQQRDDKRIMFNLAANIEFASETEEDTSTSLGPNPVQRRPQYGLTREELGSRMEVATAPQFTPSNSEEEEDSAPKDFIGTTNFDIEDLKPVTELPSRPESAIDKPGTDDYNIEDTLHSVKGPDQTSDEEDSNPEEKSSIADSATAASAATVPTAATAPVTTTTPAAATISATLATTSAAATTPAVATAPANVATTPDEAHSDGSEKSEEKPKSRMYDDDDDELEDPNVSNDDDSVKRSRDSEAELNLVSKALVRPKSGRCAPSLLRKDISPPTPPSDSSPCDSTPPENETLRGVKFARDTISALRDKREEMIVKEKSDPLLVARSKFNLNQMALKTPPREIIPSSVVTVKSNSSNISNISSSSSSCSSSSRISNNTKAQTAEVREDPKIISEILSHSIDEKFSQLRTELFEKNNATLEAFGKTVEEKLESIQMGILQLNKQGEKEKQSPEAVLPDDSHDANSHTQDLSGQLENRLASIEASLLQRLEQRLGERTGEITNQLRMEREKMFSEVRRSASTHHATAQTELGEVGEGDAWRENVDKQLDQIRREMAEQRRNGEGDHRKEGHKIGAGGRGTNTSKHVEKEGGGEAGFEARLQKEIKLMKDRLKQDFAKEVGGLEEEIKELRKRMTEQSEGDRDLGDEEITGSGDSSDGDEDKGGNCKTQDKQKEVNSSKKRLNKPNLNLESDGDSLYESSFTEFNRSLKTLIGRVDTLERSLAPFSTNSTLNNHHHHTTHHQHFPLPRHQHSTLSQHRARQPAGSTVLAGQPVGSTVLAGQLSGSSLSAFTSQLAGSKLVTSPQRFASSPNITIYKTPFHPGQVSKSSSNPRPTSDIEEQLNQTKQWLKQRALDLLSST